MSKINFEDIIEMAQQSYEYHDMTIDLKQYVDSPEEKEWTFKVRDRITVEEMDAFVNAVVSAVFVDGKYVPALKHLVEVKAIIGYYTDINTDTLDNNTLAFLAGSSSFGMIYGWHTDNEQIMSLLNAVDEQIRFTLDSSLSEQKRRLDDAIDSLNTEQHNISIQMDSVVKIFKKIAKSAEGLDKEQIQKDLHAIAGMDERKVADAVIKAKK